MRFLTVLITLVTGLANPSTQGADEGSTSPSGAVQLGSALTAEYTYYYNRNALADAVPSAGAIIAITDSGSLLRFDASTLKLTREWFGSVPATCLGRGVDQSLLVGFADGRIGRIDAANLAITELARVPGKLQWVGMIAAAPGAAPASRLVAVAEQTKNVEIEKRKFDVPGSVVFDLAFGKTYPVEPWGELPSKLRATAFLLDSKHRLWLGADNGEWGGWCVCADLDRGQIRPIDGQRIYEHTPKLLWSGVYGFAELHDGQVWAYGGTMHMGMTDGYIWRVDRGKSEELYQLDNEPKEVKERRKAQAAAAERAKEAAKRAKEKVERAVAAFRRDFVIPPERDEPAPNPNPPDEPEPPAVVGRLPTDRPYLPITHVVEDRRSGQVVVVSFSDLYLTDAQLKRWRKEHELQIRYQSGRRDAVGCYPSVRAILPDEPAGAPADLIFATRLDGLIRLRGTKETDHSLPGQMGVESIERIENSSEGILVIDGDPGSEPFRIVAGAWKAVSFAPARQVAITPAGDPEAIDHPAIPEPAEPEPWYQSQVVVSREGSIATVSATGWTPGTRTTAFWRNGKAQVAATERSSLNPSACFMTPDGALWNADQGTLMRFSDGRWVNVAAFHWPRGAGRSNWSGVGWGLRAVNDGGPPWLVHDRQNELLIRLAYRLRFQDPRLEIIPLAEAGQSERLKVRDAIAWNKGELLLATDRGLRTFAVGAGKIGVPPLNTGGRSVSHLVRDLSARLWLGGDGLAVLDTDGKTLHTLDDLPMLGRSKIEALAVDPKKPSGTIAAVEGRGVVFVNVQAK